MGDCSCVRIRPSERTDGVFDVYSSLIKERILFLSGEIDGEVGTSLAAKLLLLDSEDHEAPITLFINSNGGTIENGLLTIYDTMQYIQAPVKTICIGEAYSSAAIILSAGQKGLRGAYPSSKIMIHMLRVEDFTGTLKEYEEDCKRAKDLNKRLYKILSFHTGQSMAKIKRDCNKDKYLTAEDAIKYGLIDFIVEPSQLRQLGKKL